MALVQYACRSARLLSTVLTIATILILFSPPAFACGGVFDIACNIGKVVESAGKDVGKDQQRVLHETGKALESAVQNTKVEAKRADPKSLLRELEAKSDADLRSLAFSPDPCVDIECYGVVSDIARQAIGETRTQRQNLVDLDVRKSQAWAAVASAGISSLSLVISLASFVRAGRKAPLPASPAPVVAGQPQTS